MSGKPRSRPPSAVLLAFVSFALTAAALAGPAIAHRAEPAGATALAAAAGR